MTDVFYMYRHYFSGMPISSIAILNDLNVYGTKTFVLYEV